MHISLQKFLPHRSPMQMVDSIIEISSNHIITNFMVNEDCIFLEGKVLCEAGLIENMAQTCSAVVGQFFVNHSDPSKSVVGYISAIKKMEIFSVPQALQVIRTEAQLSSRFDSEGYSICSLFCKAFRDDVELASAEMNLFIKELNNEKK